MNFHKTIGFLATLLLVLGLGVPDSFAQSITISVPNAQKTLKENAGSVTVPITVKVAGSTVNAQTAFTLVGTNADPTDTSIPGGTVSGTVNLTPANGAITGTLDWSPTLAPDPDAVDDKIELTVTAPIGVSAAKVTSNKVTITITDTQADLPKTATDASGFRLTIASPGPGKWAKVGKNQVKVQLHRRVGVASDFGNYTGIKIDLYNESKTTGHDDKGNRITEGSNTATPLYSLTVAEAEDATDLQLSNLALASMKTDSLAFSSGVNVGTEVSGDPKHADTPTDVNIIAYKRRSRTGKYDELEFRFNIPNDTPDDRGPENLMKVYAVATFTSNSITTGTNDAIESRDTEKTIYPGNPSTFPDKVGDGNYAMIDRDPPLIGVLNSMNVNITDKNANTTGGAGIGDEIELIATVSSAFRDHSVVFQIIVPEVVTVPTPTEQNSNATTTVIGANGALVGFSKTFSAQEVFSANSRLTHKFKVTANQFKRKYTKNDPRTDPDFYKNDLREDDAMSVRARAVVKDQAGNSTNQYDDSQPSLNRPPATGTDGETTTDGLSARFTLDSKPPKVTILYPKPSGADSSRFTARIDQTYTFLGDGEQTAELKPLKFKVDEDVSGAYVVVDGGGAALKDTTDVNSSIDVGENVVDLSAGTHRAYTRTDNGKRDTKRASAEGGYNKGTKTVKLTVAVMDLSGNTGESHA